MNIFCYILKLSNGTHYCGITKNIVKRFAQHMCGNCKSTRHARPVVLVWLTDFENYSLARIQEVQIKKQGVTYWYNRNVKFANRVYISKADLKNISEKRKEDD